MIELGTSQALWVKRNGKFQQNTLAQKRGSFEGVWNDAFDSLYSNSHLQDGLGTNWLTDSDVELYTDDFVSAGYCIKVKSSAYRVTYNGGGFTPIDRNKTYDLSVMMRTLTLNGSGVGGTGYFGLSPFAADGNRVNYDNCFRGGATILTRDLNEGDSYMYVADISGWVTTGFNSVTCRCLVFPPDHPLYSTPYEFSRIVHIYDGNPVWTGSDWQIDIVATNGSPSTISGVAGYTTTAGTPVSYTRTGAGHQYLFTAYNASNWMPMDWTLHTYNGISGWGRDNASNFRYGTTHVQFLGLLNFFATGAEFLMDNFVIREAA